MSAITLNLGRNRRSAVLDGDEAEDHERLAELVATCDVVITNLRPGSASPVKRSPSEAQTASTSFSPSPVEACTTTWQVHHRIAEPRMRPAVPARRTNLPEWEGLKISRLATLAWTAMRVYQTGERLIGRSQRPGHLSVLLAAAPCRCRVR